MGILYSENMIKFNKAKKIIIENVKQLSAEIVPLNENCLNAVLAENIISQENIPNCDNSAMDGYAVKSADTKKVPINLKIIGELKAGNIFPKKLGNGEAIKIMTGAPIPQGADAVVMVENTESPKSEVRSPKLIKILKSVERGENVRKAGENIKKGELILTTGTILTPAHVGLIASIGKTKFKTFKRPKVVIITTGDEIVSASVKKLPTGKVRNSNLWTLTTLLKRDSAIPVQFETVPDNISKIKSVIRKAISVSDVVIVSAGISVGKYDYVKTALNQLGAKLLFWQVAMKPGKPFAFSKIKSIPVFSLPGNPVSTMVTYLELVRPAVLKMAGKQPASLPVLKATLLFGIRKEPGRKEFLRGFFIQKNGNYFVKPVDAQGSGILKSMSNANCFIVLDEKTAFIKKGSLIDIEILDF
ncbi:MAG: gephyrin-like molybdotransferase Glp [Elusimicrobiota bacterium]